MGNIKINFAVVENKGTIEKIGRSEIILPKVKSKIPKGNGIIPYGRDNAISRTNLAAKCLRCHLVDLNVKDVDRAVRDLIKLARLDYAILYKTKFGGYYRPTKENYAELRKYIKAEESRAHSILGSLKTAKALYEDMKYSRLEKNR